MKRKLTIVFLLVLTLSLLTSCGEAKENNEVISTESEILTNDLTEEEILPEANTEVAEQEQEAEEASTAEVQELTEEVVEEENATYTYTDMSATMYAKSSVNVRDLPSTDGNKIGSLSTNDEVHVTGQCNETNWYRFEFNGEVAYVSNSYLVNEKVAVAPPAETPSNGGGNNGGSSVSVRIGDVPTPETEAWFYKYGWTYDASTDTFIPTEENISSMYAYYGKTIGQLKAETNSLGFSFGGPYLGQIFLDESYDNVVIGSYFQRLYIPKYGHYVQTPF